MTDLLRRCWGFAAAVARFTGRRRLPVILFVALGAVLEGVGILLLVPLLATLFETGPDGGASALSAWAAAFAPGLEPVSRLSLILAIFAGLMLLRGFVLWRRDTILGGLQIAFVEAQRGAIARRLAAARWETLARLGHGRVTHLIGGDIQRCGAGVHFLIQSSVAVVMLIAQAALAFALSPLLTTIAVVLMAAGALAVSGLLRRSHDVGTLVTEANLSLMVGLGRFLSGMKLAMSQNLEGRFVDRFERELQRGSDRQTAFIGQQALLRGVWGLLAAGVAGTTMLIGFGLLHLSAPVLLALLVLLSRISAPAMQIHLGVQQIAYSLPAWEAVTALDRELAAAAPAPPASVAGPRFAGSIRFAEVVYRHGGDGERDAGVTGLDLTLDPGTMVGITGASGAGKTTLADLLAGLIFPQKGGISIGGVALTDANAAAWRDQVAYVAQDPVLFNDTVRRNLEWACPGVTDAAMARALAVAGADRIVSRLPQRLETVVGEGGALISGGERQRLALARALLRAPDLLILDEATSAIDVAAEHAILVRLRRLAPRPTIVLIAHRAESLALCDRILTLGAGRLAADERREVAA